jgi:protein-L-isoaspartate(D-aspartate) O-methyltransferase
MTAAAELTSHDPFAAARRAMIDSQLRTSGVTQPAVIAAMAAVPRENYVPDAARSTAYVDRAIALGGGTALPAPLFHGRLLAEAALDPAERVLVIGNGSAYLADLVRELAESVTPVDAAEALTLRSGEYDVILIDGAIEVLPDNLAALLVEGGRVVTGLVDRSVTRLAVGRKVMGQISWLAVADIGVPVLAQFAKPNRWSF